MAFSDQEQKIILYGKQHGKSRTEVESALARLRSGLGPRKSPSPELVAEQPEAASPDLLDRLEQRYSEGIGGALEQIPAVASGETGFWSGARRMITRPIGAAGRALGDVIGAGVSKLLPDDVEQRIGETLSPVVQPIMTRFGQLQQSNPELARDIEDAIGISELLGLGQVARPVKEGIRIASATTRSLFPKDATFRSVDEVVGQADEAIRADTPAGVRVAAEAEAPSVSLTEQWAGISPDIKRRIAGKQDKLRDYFDVAHARNVNDTAPTPFEYGSQQAQRAVEQMEKLLNETGGRIGVTRQKLGTYQASQQQISRIEDTFSTELSKLNLELRQGVIRQKPGTVKKAGTGDIRALNDLYQDLRVIKQSPSLLNLIELRSAFDSRINFGKRAAEVSNEVDPLARRVRRDIADQAATIVGKTEAAELQRFSEFMDAYNDLRSYTDRRAGGEYLLRLVLSGRGGEARNIIQTIKEHTGIDLMDDATMMTIATDLIGNARQKNLFRQEMTKAGLDAASILKGDVTGAAATLFQKGLDQLLDPEEIFLKAAQ